jgi:hypothetical protein
MSIDVNNMLSFTYDPPYTFMCWYSGIWLFKLYYTDSLK